MGPKVLLSFTILILRCCTAFLLGGSLAVNACSVSFVNQYSDFHSRIENAVGFRTMDFEFGTLTGVKKGVKGALNVSRVNIGHIPREQAVSWENKFNFIGVSFGNTLSDGMNEAGLYAGALYMPGETKYPEFEPFSGKKALGVLDIVNFVLGTSGSVAEAAYNLESVQVVMNAYTMLDIAYSAPLHFFLKDKSGKGGVVEFTNGAIQVYQGSDIDTLTNSPDYQWQVSNYKTKVAGFVHKNTDEKVKGIIENGSGYKGLAGDFTPTSRFVRLKTLIAAQPKASTNKSVDYLARSLLHTMIVPVGMNPAASIWYSYIDLQHGEYKVTKLVTLAFPTEFPLRYIVPKTTKEKDYSLKKLDQIREEVVLSFPYHQFAKDKVKYTALPAVGTPYKTLIE